MSKTAIITGITGQDGFYLADYLLKLGYRVVGIDRRTSLPTDARLKTLRGSPNLIIVNGDVTDYSSIQEAIRLFTPDEFYHLAAQSHVALSWKSPISTVDITGNGTLNCLEAIRKEKPDCRFYFAGSSEQFGNTLSNNNSNLLNEKSPMNPESPYAAAKLFGYNITQVYRRSYKLFASAGILFNHESAIRGEQFVTRKITSTLAKIYWKQENYLELGNINSYRDWGFAGDYVKAMHLIINHEYPDDFVIATGRTYSVSQFLDKACEYFKLSQNEVLKIKQEFIRPQDVNILIGDASKARIVLGWQPETSFDQLVDSMCKYDYHCQAPHENIYRKSDQFLYPGETDE